MRTQSLSKIVDDIVDIFSTVKREQSYFRIKQSPGSFYYYTFMGSIFSRHPVIIYESDILSVEGYPDLIKQERRAAVYQAVRKFLGDNGQSDIIERVVSQNKLDVVIR